MKRRALALTLILALASSVVAEAQFVRIVWSEPSYWWPGMVIPTISIVSPQNNTSYLDRVPIFFDITPGSFEPGTSDGNTFWGYRYTYLWDYGQQISADGVQNDPSLLPNTTLTGLPAGTHRIVLYLYFHLSRSAEFSVSSEPVFFTVIRSPVISITTPENKPYNTTNIALNFTVDKSTSWIGYSLDNQENITITGNTTLSGLSNGQHQVAVYANDTLGKMGSSTTTYFKIETGEPFPTIWIVAAVVSAVVVIAGLIFYLRKRKPWSKE